MHENNQDLDRADEIAELEHELLISGHTRLFIKPSIISDDCEFTGEIRAPGTLSVDGVITGKLMVGSLTIGAQGIVSGEVAAETVNVKGRFSGQMSCQDITIGGGSVVDADLTYSSIVVQRGGVLKGDVHKK